MPGRNHQKLSPGGDCEFKGNEKEDPSFRAGATESMTTVEDLYEKLRAKMTKKHRRSIICAEIDGQTQLVDIVLLDGLDRVKLVIVPSTKGEANDN